MGCLELPGPSVQRLRRVPDFLRLRSHRFFSRHSSLSVSEACRPCPEAADGRVALRHGFLNGFADLVAACAYVDIEVRSAHAGIGGTRYCLLSRTAR
jgi:hypothetical protein